MQIKFYGKIPTPDYMRGETACIESSVFNTEYEIKSLFGVFRAIVQHLKVCEAHGFGGCGATLYIPVGDECLQYWISE